MITLAIDTSNQPMSVAIAQDETLLAEVTINIKKNHSIQLMPAIDHLLKQVNISPKELNQIVVAEGPGSYTGLRIGMTTAKTMAWSLKIPIVAISSLKMLAANFLYNDGLICPFFDARRGRVFTGLYQVNKGIIEEVKNDCNVSMDDWLNELNEIKEPIIFITPNGDPFFPIIHEKLNQAIIAKHYFNIPRASKLIALSYFEKPTDSHLVKPEYHRITEAEANWLRENKKG